MCAEIYITPYISTGKINVFKVLRVVKPSLIGQAHIYVSLKLWERF